MKIRFLTCIYGNPWRGIKRNELPTNLIIDGIEEIQNEHLKSKGFTHHIGLKSCGLESLCVITDNVDEAITKYNLLKEGTL